jgi:hypothetical protein
MADAVDASSPLVRDGISQRTSTALRDKAAAELVRAREAACLMGTPPASGRCQRNGAASRLSDGSGPHDPRGVGLGCGLAVQEGRGDLPQTLHAVGPGEQRLVTEHGVENEPLIALEALAAQNESW